MQGSVWPAPGTTQPLNGTDGQMADETRSWIFGETSLYLVGPVVGKVTGSDARILVEAAHDAELRYNAYIDGKSVDNRYFNVRARRPFAFVVRGLVPGKAVRVEVSLGAETRAATFRTPSDKTEWKIAAVSCNNHKWKDTIHLWEKMAKDASAADVLLHMGDQCYGDVDFQRSMWPDNETKFDTDPEGLDSAWGKAVAIVKFANPNSWESLREEVRECYRTTYRRTWAHPPTARVLVSVANYMVIDDHEVVDDFGDMPSHHDPKSMQYFIICCAYQVYMEYQMQLMVDCDVSDFRNKVFYSHLLSPKVGLIMLDLRVERSIHKPYMKDDPTKTYLGVEQWAWLHHVLRGELRDVQTLLVVSPGPVVFLNKTFNKLVEKKVDDVRGAWAYPLYSHERLEFANVLTEWQEERGDRGICVLAGDIHVGGFSTFQSQNKATVINQMISSAVGNMPTVDVPALAGKAALELQQFDSTLVVDHLNWIWKPNYGILDIHLKAGERPFMTGQLIGEASTETHTLEYKQGTIREALTRPGCACCNLM